MGNLPPARKPLQPTCAHCPKQHDDSHGGDCKTDGIKYRQFKQILARHSKQIWRAEKCEGNEKECKNNYGSKLSETSLHTIYDTADVEVVTSAALCYDAFTMDCPECGRWNPEDKTVCWKCQTPMPKRQPEKPKRKGFGGMPSWAWIGLGVLFLLTNLGSCFAFNAPAG